MSYNFRFGNATQIFKLAYNLLMTSTSIRNHPLIFPVYLPTFLISLAGGILTPVLPLFLRDFDVGYGLVGLVLSGQAIGMLVADIPSGMVLRWLGQRSRRTLSSLHQLAGQSGDLL